MYKIFILALREYRVSVRSRSFLIGLIIAPILMGGGIAASILLQDKVDIHDKKIAVLDHTGQVSEAIVNRAKYRREHEIFDSTENKKVKPDYIIEIIEPDTADINSQRLKLSNKVRSKKLHAIVEIGSGMIHPSLNRETAYINYYSENSLADDVRGWLKWPINNKLRKIRMAEQGLDESSVGDLFVWSEISGMDLVKKNSNNSVGEVQHSNPVQAFLIPLIFMMLIFMMVMMSANPLLNAVMEEKTERIAEVVLGSATPFQFMMAKLLGGVAVSVTSAAVYIAGGIFTATKTGYGDMIPYELLPWFFAYLILAIFMMGAIMASLGAMCNDTKEAQSLQFPAILPMIIPMMLLSVLIKEPMGSLSTTLSFIPPFTPTVMLLRQASPTTLPLWQPIVGIVGVFLFTLLCVWAGGKIFRMNILTHGTRPKFGAIVKMLFSRS